MINFAKYHKLCFYIILVYCLIFLCQLKQANDNYYKNFHNKVKKELQKYNQ
jgi:hypothetical protein